MFSNLIESGPHGRDLKRKGSFFLGTFLFYAVLLGAAGVGSIYAYNVRLDAQSEYELLAVMRFPAAAEKAEPAKPPPAETRPAEAPKPPPPAEAEKDAKKPNPPENPGPKP